MVSNSTENTMPTVVSTATQAAASSTYLTTRLDMVARAELRRQRAQAEGDAEQPEDQAGADNQRVGPGPQRRIDVGGALQRHARLAGIAAGRDRNDVAQRRAALQVIVEQRRDRAR